MSTILLTGFWCLHHLLSLWLRAQLHAKGRENQRRKTGPVCQPAQHQWVCVFPFMKPCENSSRRVFQCCLLHRMASPPMQEWGRSGDLCYSLIGWSNWPAFLVYVFCLSLVFSLNMHLLDLPVMDVCCGAVSFDLSPGCGSYQFKTTANMRLLNGFPFFFCSFFPFTPCPCLSVFITPLQVFKSNARRSLRWMKMDQGWYPMEGIPLMKRMKGHTAVRQITHNSHAHCPEYLQTQSVY